MNLKSNQFTGRCRRALIFVALMMLSGAAAMAQSITAPVATTPQRFCNGATVANLSAQGANIKWYDAATGGNEYLPADVLVNGSIYYAAQSSGSNESAVRTAVTVILQSNVILGAPNIPSPQALCAPATLEDVLIPSEINPNNIRWYDAATGGNLLPATTPIPNPAGGTYYAALTAGGACESATRTPVSINVTTSTPSNPTITPSMQSFCTGSTIANIAVPNNRILWYDADVLGGALLPESTILTPGVYYAAMSAGSCISSTRTPVTIQINNTTLPAPTGPAAQSICGGGTLNDLQITGSHIIWYSAANVVLPTNTPLVDGTTYYAVQSTGNCESAARLGVTVTINERLNPPAATTPQTLCPGATVSNLVAKGLGIKWYDAANNLLAATDPLVDGETYFATQSAVGSCESLSRTAVTVILKAMELPAPAILPNPQNLCEPATVADIIIPTGINNVVWYNASNVELSSTDPLTSGTRTYYAAIRVGSCESATRTAVVFNIVSSHVPGAPSPIGSPQNFCPGATVADIVVPNNQVVIFETSTSPSPLAPETVLTTGTYHAKQIAGTCESIGRTPITVNVGTPSAPEAPSPQTFCLSGTVANLAVTGAGVAWYVSNTDVSPLALNTPLATGEYFAVSGVCNGPRTKVDVTVLADGLLPPSATTPQTFCTGAVVSKLQVKGTGVKWYTQPTGGTPLLNSDALTSAIYYAAQSTDLCESVMRTAVNVVIDNTLVLDPPDITSPQRMCQTATLADVAIPTGVNPANIKWYAAAAGGSSLDPATILSVSGTYYAATTAGSCESAERTAVAITIGPTPPEVPLIVSPQNFCPGALISNINVPNNQIRWYAALNGGSQLPSNTVLLTGTYYATQGAGGCESSPRLPVQIVIGASMGAPDITSPQMLPYGNTIADLAATGVGLVWYEKNSNTPLALTHLLESKLYEAEQTSGSCSGDRAEVSVTLLYTAYGLIFDVTTGLFHIDIAGDGDPTNAVNIVYTGQSGQWSFSNNTLYLNGFLWETSAPRALTVAGGNLNIDLTGTNTFKSTLNGPATKDLAGIYATGLTLTVGGSGALEAIGGSTTSSFESYGIFGDVIITDGAVTAQGETQAFFPDVTPPAAYDYWTSTTAADPGGAATYSGDVAFDNTAATYKFVKIEAQSPIVISVTPPGIDGPVSMTLTAGYAATSTGVYTTTGLPAPVVTKTGGDAAITWNNTTQKLDIAAGLAPGIYTVVLTASNGVSPDATITFTLTVLPVYYVTYHANGGTGMQTDPDSPYLSGIVVTVLDTGTIIRPHYVFTCWNTRPDGLGISYVPGDDFTVTGDVALYAQWKEYPYIDPIIQRSITIAPSLYGRVVSDRQYAATRETVTLTILPESGYLQDSITVHNYFSETTTVPLTGDGDMRMFLMPPYQVIVRATFKLYTQTGVETPRATSLQAYVQDGMLHVSGLAAGEPWRVFNILGAIVYQGVAVDETAKIQLPARGIFIVADGKAVLKIIY